MTAYLVYLVYLRDRLRSSFWLVPSLMTLGALLTSLVMIWIDTLPWVANSFWWMASSSNGAEGARLVLSTIAGSMITVASLVFSMTLVALTLAAANIGPRLLDRFMDNRINQIALGLFLATFVYSLLILRAVTNGDPPFIPHLSVSLAMVMAIFSFGWLIYFIHDLARSIQVDNVIARVGGELDIGFRELAKQHPDAVVVPMDQQGSGTSIRAEKAGYIQAVDPQALRDLAEECDVVIRMRHRPGQFVIPTTAIAEVIGPVDDKLGDKVRDAVVFGPKRTASQDTAFSIDLIVEIAARALSPGVNDFYTALACVDHVGAALETAFDKGLPGNGFQDDTGRLRLVLDPITYDGLVDTAFHPLRRAASDNVSVIVRLLETLTLLAEGRPPDHHANAAIERHGHLIHQGARAHGFSDCDQLLIDDRHAALQNRLHVEARD